MRKFDLNKYIHNKNILQKFLFNKSIDTYEQIVNENKRKEKFKKVPINLLNSEKVIYINSFQKKAVLRRRIKKNKINLTNSREMKVSKNRSIHAKKRKRDKNGKFIQTIDIFDKFDFNKLFN